MSLHDSSTPEREQAEQVLRSLEADVELVPAPIRKWWGDYLQFQHDRFLDTLSFVDKDAEILEVGSAPGQFTILLDRLGYRVKGVDLAPERLAPIWCKYEISIAQADVEQDKLPFPDESFDIVLFMEILEHLRLNPLHALREVRRVLRPNGRIVLSTPNITPLHRLRFFVGKSYFDHPLETFGKLEWLGHAGHIRLYSLEEIEDVLREIGFRQFSHAYSGEFPAGWKPRLYMALHPANRQHFRPYVVVVGTK